MARSANNKQSRAAETFSVFAFGAISWFAAIMYFELAPKSSTYRDTMRLVYTMGYFLCVLGLLRHLKLSGPAFVGSLFRYRYDGAPLGMEHAWKNLLEECSFVLNTLTLILMYFIASTAISVLTNWFSIPSVLVGVNQFFWWGALATLVVFVYWFPASLDNMFKHFRYLRHQVETCDFYSPREISEFWKIKNVAANRVASIDDPERGFVVGNRPWTFAALAENLIAFGSTGSGKTVCVMNAFLSQFIASTNLQEPACGLVIDFKGDYHKKLKRLCRKYSRTSDLIVLSTNTPHKWNPLDSKESASELAARFVATMKALGQKDQQTSFFADAAEAFLEHAITLLRNSNNNDEPPTVYDIHHLANNLAFLEERIDVLPVSVDDLHRSTSLVRCKSYFEHEYFSLPDDTRMSVMATLNNMLNPLCNELVSSIIDGPSTVDLIEATQRKSIVYLHLPSSQNPRAGRVLGLLLKLAFYAEVKKKAIDAESVSFFFADEFQEFFTGDGEAGDPRFFAVSREFNHCNVVASQNLNNFTMQGDKKDAVMSLLGNIKTKIFLQNSDEQTNDYASKLFGSHLAVHGGANIGGHAQIIPNLTPSDFISLRTPERGACDHCESYVLIETGSKVDVANRSMRWPIFSIMSNSKRRKQ